MNAATDSRQRFGSLDILALLAAAGPWLAAALLEAVPQWASYHDFADQRALLGIPHALNVVSNLPFLVVGALGLACLLRDRSASPVMLPYGLLFTGASLTAFGSAWYHADPRDATLVWDRLPMALGFAGLVAGTLADRVPGRAAAFTVTFGVVGVATVLFWRWTGNLLPYLVMQATFVGAALYATARVPSPFSHAHWLYGAAILYAAALVCERFDKVIDAALGGSVSGHTLKHLLAAIALLVIVGMLRARRRLSGSPAG